MDFHHEMPKKVDFTEKFYDIFHATQGVVDFVTVPKLNYMVSKGVGHSSIKESSFGETSKFLGGLAFSMKFRLKRIGHESFEDYSMPPKQATWTNMVKDKAKRKWELNLLQPNTITKDILKKSIEVAKMKQQDIILPTISLKSIKPGLCIQTLHVGPHEEKDKTIKLLHKTAKKEGYVISGDHHEIYLNDMRRTPAAKLLTIIRYQIKKA